MYALSPKLYNDLLQHYHNVMTLIFDLTAKNYRIRKNIGEELNLANWRIKIKSPTFNLANFFCTRLTQNLARDPSVVAVI